MVIKDKVLYFVKNSSELTYTIMNLEKFSFLKFYQ